MKIFRSIIFRSMLAALLGMLLAMPAMAQATAPARPSATMPGGTGKTVPPPGTSPNAPSPEVQRQGGLIDINSASSQELDSLPGIGSARAEAIIANRPYRSKDELARRKILPPKVYEQIKDRIVARQGTPSPASGTTGPTEGMGGGGTVRPPAGMPQRSR